MKRFALPVKLIEEAPQAFIPGGIGDRVKRLRQVGRAIGWNANVIEFVGSFPAVLTCTPQKIGVHALLFARSAQADLTPEQVCKRLTLPIDQHLRAVLREKRPDLMPFRPCPAAELLQASWVKKTLGKRIIDAYAAL